MPYLGCCDSVANSSPAPRHSASHRRASESLRSCSPTTTIAPSTTSPAYIAPTIPHRQVNPKHPHLTMSSTDSVYPDFFRRRPIGRAPSPPTWACYEQIPYGDDYSDSASDNDSCSEDEDDYEHARSDLERPDSAGNARSPQIDGDMEIDEGDEPISSEKVAEMKKKDVKGKQRAVEHFESPKREHRKKQRQQPVFTLRPILTIQKSQGFVWNQVSPRKLVAPACGTYSRGDVMQDLFIPPYIKDRCSFTSSTSFPRELTWVLIVLCVSCRSDVASMSPSNPHGFVSSSVSSTNSSMMDYEVEVVEIRVREGELKDIIP